MDVGTRACNITCRTALATLRRATPTSNFPSGKSQILSDYDRYVRLEWEQFRKRHRRRRMQEAGIQPGWSRVLDVGCGAGQEMIPFVVGTEALGVGLDVSPEVGRAGRELFDAAYEGVRVVFVRGTAESLPFDGETFDVVVCRLTLPYVDNVRALSEFARVLRRGGSLLLTIHHPTYYLRKLWNAVRFRDPRSAAYALRVLATGGIYHLTGQQPQMRSKKLETFQTQWLLRRELTRQRLAFRRELPYSETVAPTFVIVKV